MVLEAIRLRCGGLMGKRIRKGLPEVISFTLVACILGVEVYVRRMCETARPITQASAGSVTPAATEDAHGSKTPEADTRQLTLPGPQSGIEFRIGQRDLAVHYDCEPIAPVQFDIQLNVDLVRHGSNSKGETLGGR